MLTQERYHIILKVLQERGTVTVTELTGELHASESTVRRDLSALHDMGKLIKVHGGATALGGDFSGREEDVSTKEEKNAAQKERIARCAAKLIHEGDFIYLDAGTTTGRMIEYIEEKKAVFVTNGIVHAKKLIQKGLKTYVIGGQLKPSTEAIVGTVAVDNLKKYNFTKCFMGTNGIDLIRGFTTPDPEEALLKEEAVIRSYMAFVLADASKFNRVSAVSFAPLEKACIITDKVAEEKYRKQTVIKEVLE